MSMYTDRETTMDTTRLVEQAREYCSGSMRKQGEALVAGLADAVEQHTDCVDRASWDKLTCENVDLRARVAALEAAIAKHLDSGPTIAAYDELRALLDSDRETTR